MGADGYNKGSWHERSSQNDQRQGKNGHGKDTKANCTDLVQINFLPRVFLIRDIRVSSFFDRLGKPSKTKSVDYVRRKSAEII